MANIFWYRASIFPVGCGKVWGASFSDTFGNVCEFLNLIDIYQLNHKVVVILPFSLLIFLLFGNKLTQLNKYSVWFTTIGILLLVMKYCFWHTTATTAHILLLLMEYYSYYLHNTDTTGILLRDPILYHFVSLFNKFYKQFLPPPSFYNEAIFLKGLFKSAKTPVAT